MATETNTGQTILLAPEAEAMIQALQEFDIESIGTQAWYRHHEYVGKLNMQAVLSASNHDDEFIKEFLVNHDKVKILVRDLITTSVWVDKVFSQLIEMKYEPKTSFSIYLILYHEATIINLLETILYHQEAMESIDDVILDLADYCYDNLCYMTGTLASKPELKESLIKAKKNTSSTMVDRSSMEELVEQRQILKFEISVKSLSILRYLTDHLSTLSLSVSSRLLNTYDIPVLLEALIENPPWLFEQGNGTVMKYMDNAWHEVTPDAARLLSKLEGQAWLALYQLLMNEDCQRKYDLTAYRKSVLMKLRVYLTQVLLDQLPILGNLLRFLEYLGVMDPPPYRKDLIIEQVPEHRDGLISKHEGRWGQVAKKFIKMMASSDTDAEMRRYAANWVASYDSDLLESLIDSPPKCAVCGDPASKRCSRCQNEWYCSRECQVGHWKKHKKACDLLVDSLKKMEALSTK